MYAAITVYGKDFLNVYHLSCHVNIADGLGQQREQIYWGDKLGLDNTLYLMYAAITVYGKDYLNVEHPSCHANIIDGF